MKVIEQTQATDALADYAAKIDSGPVVVTSHGQPVAALVPIENADMETVAWSTNREFLDLIEQGWRHERCRTANGACRLTVWLASSLMWTIIPRGFDEGQHHVAIIRKRSMLRFRMV